MEKECQSCEYRSLDLKEPPCCHCDETNHLWEPAPELKLKQTGNN